MGLNIYLCPFCLGKLRFTRNKRALRCLQCNRTYQVKKGIPILSEKGHYYYGEVSSSECSVLLDSLKKSKSWDIGFKQYLNSISESKADYLINYILGSHRMSFKFLLSIDQNYRVLDLGCGWGTISVNLANYVKEVFSADLTFERLVFLKRWKEFKNLNNIRLCCTGDCPYLPYPRNNFDLVILNGVLEWVPECKKGKPLKVQVDYLKEIKRILKESGQLYLAIENRYNYKYFLGKPDDHSGLKFASILPRRISNFYSILKRGKEYRTYTHSLKNYLSMLKKVGFSKIGVFIPEPIYRYPEKFTKKENIESSGKSFDFLNRKYSCKKSFKKKLKYKIKKYSFFPYIAPSFSFIANVEKEKNSIIESVLLKEFPECSFKIIDYLVSKTGAFHATILCKKRYEKKEIVMKLPILSNGNRRLENNYNNISLLHNGDFNFKKLIPESITKGIYCNQKYYIEEYINGIAGDKLINNNIYDLIKFAAEAILRVHKETYSYQSSIKTFAKIQKIYNQVRSFGWEKEETKIIRNAFNTLKNQMNYIKFPTVFSHNDFHLGNILFEKGVKHVCGIIDLDFSDMLGFPGIDLFHLISRSNKQKFNNDLPLTIKKTVINKTSVYQENISNYFEQLELKNDTFFKLLYILYLLWRNIYVLDNLVPKGIYSSSVDNENSKLINLMKCILE